MPLAQSLSVLHSVMVHVYIDFISRHYKIITIHEYKIYLFFEMYFKYVREEYVYSYINSAYRLWAMHFHVGKLINTSVQSVRIYWKVQLFMFGEEYEDIISTYSL